MSLQYTSYEEATNDRMPSKYTTFDVDYVDGKLVSKNVSPVRNSKLFGMDFDDEWDYVWEEVCKNVEMVNVNNELKCLVKNPQITSFTTKYGTIFTANYLFGSLDEINIHGTKITFTVSMLKEKKESNSHRFTTKLQWENVNPPEYENTEEFNTLWDSIVKNEVKYQCKNGFMIYYRSNKYCELNYMPSGNIYEIKYNLQKDPNPNPITMDNDKNDNSICSLGFGAGLGLGCFLY